MITYQDFAELWAANKSSALAAVVEDWRGGKIFKTAVLADTYDRQENDTINNFVKRIFALSGEQIRDFTASNAKIASNFFRRLNTQRNTYSLGNGVSFARDGVKERFGAQFDTKLFRAGYLSLVHGVSFCYWSGELHPFEATEFAPLWDEETGVLRAGVRFWQIDHSKPRYMVLYEQDGFTKYKDEEGEITEVAPKRTYLQTVRYSDFGGIEIIDGHNYAALPIVPLYGSVLRQSTLVGLRSQIDSYDLIRSGFANDLTDVSQIYWIIENYGGMSDSDLARFRDRLKLNHIATADTSEGGKITPYAQDIPFQARQAYLDSLEKSIYRDFGALDVHSVSASSTNDHLEAAYQPLDENADDFETQIIEFVQTLGSSIIGLPAADCTPLFKRNRISNQAQTVEMLVQAAEWLDEETIIKNLPFITVDEIEGILQRRAADELGRYTTSGADNGREKMEGTT